MCSLLNRFSGRSHRKCSVWKSVLKNFLQILRENTCVGVSFNTCVGVSFSKVAGLKLYQKRDFNRDIFLWNLLNFQKHLYSKASMNDYFLFSESNMSFFFFVWQISSTSISTEYKVGIFFKFSNLIWSMYKLKNVSLTFQSTLLSNSY